MVDANKDRLPIPNIVSKTLICIDKAENCDFYGRIYNPYMKECVPFREGKQILTIMEDFFDWASFPQANFARRSFTNRGNARSVKPAAPGEVVRHFSDDLFDRHEGELVTVLMAVQFRRQADWQGVAECRETGERREFRSAVALLRMLIEAVESVLGRSMFEP